MFIQELNQPVSSVKLLPQSSDMQLTNPTLVKKILTLKLYLVNEAIVACEHFFIKRNVAAFDPHIGDTLCQIRGHMFLWLFKFFPDIDAKAQILALKELSTRIHDVLFERKLSSQRFKTTNLIDFLSEHNLFCEINELIVLLTESYLLSRFKKIKDDGNICMDYSRLILEMDIPKSLMRKLVHVYQVDMSEKSTAFVCFIINRYEGTHIDEFVKQLIRHDDEDRMVMPCYFIMDYLYKDLLRSKWPILIVVNRISAQENDTICMLFRPDIVGGNYIYQNTIEFNEMSKHCFVIKGDAIYQTTLDKPEMYVHQFLTHGLERIIFANMAAHPQYSGKRLKEISDDPYLALNKGHEHSTMRKNITSNLYNNFILLKNDAELMGCSAASPALLFIRHIYCDNLYTYKLQQSGDTLKSHYYAEHISPMAYSMNFKDEYSHDNTLR